MTTHKIINYTYIKRDNKTNYLFLYFKVKAKISQTDSKMDDLMNSLTAGLKKAKEDRRRVETEVYRSQNPLAKYILKAESCSQSSSSITQFAGPTQISKNFLSNGNQNARHTAIKVF